VTVTFLFRSIFLFFTFSSPDRESNQSLHFDGGDIKERDHLEDLVLDGRIILKSIIKEVEWGDVDWIGLFQYTEK
jgi:hypothetical protein